MKKIIILAVLFGFTLRINAQITELTNGNIGIGETSPSSKLHIKGPNLWLKLQDSNATSYATTNAGIQFNNYYATVGQIFQTGEDLVMESRGSVSNLVFKTQTVERVRINKDGNVGIGTTTPDSKLTVKGLINSREVKVTATAGGADFVFEKDYDLLSLEEVETYVKKNKHLPEIASAKEMAKDGIHLAEMNIKLLQKIEELTLYTIQHQKEIEALKSITERLTKIEKQFN